MPWRQVITPTTSTTTVGSRRSARLRAKTARVGSPTRAPYAGDVVLHAIEATLGDRCAFIPKADRRLPVNQARRDSLRPDRTVDSRVSVLLLHCSRSEHSRCSCATRCGATVTESSRDELAELSSSVPDLHVQQPHRRHPLRLRRPDREQPAADGAVGGGGAAALPRVVRPPPLPRPRAHPHHQRRAGGVGATSRLAMLRCVGGGTPIDDRCRLLGRRRRSPGLRRPNVTTTQLRRDSTPTSRSRRQAFSSSARRSSSRRTCCRLG